MTFALRANISLHRLVLKSCTCRFIFPESSTNCLKISKRLQKDCSSRGKFSHFNLNSKSVAQRWTKVIQGHRLIPFAEKLIVCRSYSSVEHGTSQNSSVDKEKKQGQMGDVAASSVSVPNDTWTAESLELHKRLTSELLEQGSGDWCKHQSTVYHGERRLFTKALISEYPGKFFEYEFFFSKKEQRLKGVIQFGPYTQGPPGCVHGGASASMLDGAIGVCVTKSFPRSVTASLSMNFKSLLPLGTTVLVESRIDKVEGRKIFGSAELKSPDGKVTYLTANALFIHMDPPDIEKL